MWIDKSNFFGKLLINKQGENLNKLQDYIDMYQQEYLDIFFGSENAEIIYENKDNPDYKFVVDILESKISPIACYVFYKYQIDNVMVSAQIGDARPSYENAVLASNTYRMRLAWNEMVDKNIKMQCYINSNKSKFNLLKSHRIENGFFKKINDADL